MHNLVRAAVVAAALAAPTLALAQDGDPAAGEKAFRICMACHAVGERATNRVGPELNEIIGRQPGHLEGYQYSPAMVKFGDGKVWDAALLDEYLAAPRQVVQGTKMAFPGVRDAKQRADLIAYLATFSAPQ